MSEPGDLIAGRYRLQRLIGTGAMGVVWQARDELLNRVIAVKKLLIQPGLEPARADEARRRAMREGRVAARLHHPHVIGVFDVVVDDDLPVLVMEYLPSRSLAELMSERGQLPAEEVARIGAQAASALAAAHDAGVVHRDVKPANILIAHDGSTKITDFGISHATGDVVVTQTGMVAGTPAYLAPEVARGTKPSPASDVFSLGATLYAAVEGTPPFGGAGENSLSLLHKVAAGQFPPPQQAGVLAGTLRKMMQPDAAERASVREAEQLLTQAAAGQQPTAVLGAWPGAEAPTDAMNPPTLPGVPPLTEYGEPVPEETEPPKRSGRRWAIVALVVALLAGIGLAAYFLFDGDDPRSETVELTPAAMEQAVADYYDLLPDQAGQAWQRLGPALREQGKQNYLDRWSKVNDLDTIAEPRATSSDTVRVGIELELGDGTVRNEVHSLTLITSSERLLINDDKLLRKHETAPTTIAPETVTKAPAPTTTTDAPPTTTTTQTTTTTEPPTTTTEPPTTTTEPPTTTTEPPTTEPEEGATDDGTAGE